MLFLYLKVFQMSQSRSLSSIFSYIDQYGNIVHEYEYLVRDNSLNYEHNCPNQTNSTLDNGVGASNYYVNRDYVRENMQHYHTMAVYNGFYCTSPMMSAQVLHDQNDAPSSETGYYSSHNSDYFSNTPTLVGINSPPKNRSGDKKTKNKKVQVKIRESCCESCRNKESEDKNTAKQIFIDSATQTDAQETNTVAVQTINSSQEKNFCDSSTQINLLNEISVSINEIKEDIREVPVDLQTKKNDIPEEIENLNICEAKTQNESHKKSEEISSDSFNKHLENISSDSHRENTELKEKCNLKKSKKNEKENKIIKEEAKSELKICLSEFPCLTANPENSHEKIDESNIPKMNLENKKSFSEILQIPKHVKKSVQETKMKSSTAISPSKNQNSMIKAGKKEVYTKNKPSPKKTNTKIKEEFVSNSFSLLYIEESSPCVEKELETIEKIEFEKREFDNSIKSEEFSKQSEINNQISKKEEIKKANDCLSKEESEIKDEKEVITEEETEKFKGAKKKKKKNKEQKESLNEINVKKDETEIKDIEEKNTQEDIKIYKTKKGRRVKLIRKNEKEDPKNFLKEENGMETREENGRIVLKTERELIEAQAMKKAGIEFVKSCNILMRKQKMTDKKSKSVVLKMLNGNEYIFFHGFSSTEEIYSSEDISFVETLFTTTILSFSLCTSEDKKKLVSLAMYFIVKNKEDTIDFNFITKLHTIFEFHQKDENSIIFFKIGFNYFLRGKYNFNKSNIIGDDIWDLDGGTNFTISSLDRAMSNYIHFCEIVDFKKLPNEHALILILYCVSSKFKQDHQLKFMPYFEVEFQREKKVLWLK